MYHAALALFSISSVGSALAPSIALFLLGRCARQLGHSVPHACGGAAVPRYHTLPAAVPCVQPCWPGSLAGPPRCSQQDCTVSKAGLSRLSTAEC